MTNDEIAAKKTLIVIWHDRDPETFDAEDAEYWIRRRYEKEGRTPERCYIGEPFDFEPILTAFDKEQSEYESELAEERDRRTYERLKAKYDK